MSVPRAIEEFLKQRNATYTYSVHAPSFSAQQLASTEHIAPRNVAKTVVFLGDGCFAMAVLPGDERVNLGRLKRALGLARIRLATEAELGQLFPDCELGAMPPLGNLYGLPVYVDERLAGEKNIEFDGGTHFDVIHMSFSEFTRLVRPVMTNFGEVLAA